MTPEDIISVFMEVALHLARGTLVLIVFSPLLIFIIPRIIPGLLRRLPWFRPRLLDRFQRFFDLPLEIQLAIWGFMRDERPIRHYVFYNADYRYYGAYDVQDKKFITDSMVNNPNERTVNNAADPLVSEVLIGDRVWGIDDWGVLRASRGGAYTRTSLSQPRPRINFSKDVIFLDFKLSSRNPRVARALSPDAPPNARDALRFREDWWAEVQHLALWVPRSRRAHLTNLQRAVLSQFTGVRHIYLMRWNGPSNLACGRRQVPPALQTPLMPMGLLEYEVATRLQWHQHDALCNQYHFYGQRGQKAGPHFEQTANHFANHLRDLLQGNIRYFNIYVVEDIAPPFKIW